MNGIRKIRLQARPQSRPWAWVAGVAAALLCWWPQTPHPPSPPPEYRPPAADTASPSPPALAVRLAQPALAVRLAQPAQVDLPALHPIPALHIQRTRRHE